MRNTIQKLMCMFLLLGATYVYGQRTAYENKVIEIKAKYLRKFGMPAQEVEVLRKRGDFLLDSALNQQANKYEKRYGNAVMLATLLEMGKEIKEAEKLKTTAELNKEANAKKQAEEKRIKREQKIEAERVKSKALSIKQNKDLYKLKQNTREHFIQWASRGEFEKKEEYEQRMLNKEKKLAQIFLQNLKEWVADREAIKIDLLKYDPDNEIYNLSTNSHFWRNDNQAEMIASIKVSPHIAQEMKNESGYFTRYSLYEMDASEVDLKDMVIQEDNIFFSKIVFNDRIYRLNIPNTYTDMEKFTFSTDELGLSEYFLENKNINISEEKTISKSSISKHNQKPQLHGGIGALRNKFMENFDNEAVEGNGIVKAEINFTINEDCSISEIVVKGGNASFNKEAERVMRVISRYKICEKPAMVDGIPVKEEMKFPVNIRF